MLFFASCPSSLYEILLKASPPTPQLPLPSSPPILTDDAIRLDRAHAYRLPLTLLPLVNPNSPRSTPARLQSPPIPFPAPRRYPGYPLTYSCPPTPDQKALEQSWDHTALRLSMLFRYTLQTRCSSLQFQTEYALEYTISNSPMTVIMFYPYFGIPAPDLLFYSVYLCFPRILEAKHRLIVQSTEVFFFFATVAPT